MRIVVDTSTVIAVVAGEAEKAKLIELTKDATIAAPPFRSGTMMVYSYAEVREGLSALLERASTEGQIKFRSRDGRVFIIRPEQPLRTSPASPFDVRSVKPPITKLDILEAIRESRARF